MAVLTAHGPSHEPSHEPAHRRTLAAGVPLAMHLARHGDRVAIITGERQLTYRELAAEVDDAARTLGERRRLVLVAGTNRLESLVTYLGALAAGHPVLLAPGGLPDHVERLVATYDPDVVVRPDGDREQLTVRRPGSAHALHPDLALMLSTSGSTGAPKSVRLSRTNVQANAESIADYLGITPGDRAATTLPMHYCYGLSVINSHLLRGAGLILTDLSVIDDGFWSLFREHRGTTFAGVPYTFDLLDRIGFADLRLDHLRYVTQAGGRLAPDQVRRYAELGRRNGWDLFVMYGQTEATARMAYLPPDMAETRPESIGVPIPGGSFSLEQLPGGDGNGGDGSVGDGPDVGELVYSGPNVMLGYAESPRDLALGRTVDRLRTGDVARRAPDGLYEVIGRRSRFVKITGLRIDLDQAEAVLARSGVTACCVGDDEELVIAVPGRPDVPAVRRLAADRFGLPRHAVRVCPLAELPRLPSGKPDYTAVGALAAAGRGTAPDLLPARDGGGDRLRALFAQVLGIPPDDVTPDSTFVALGGDSLSYVQMSVRLERELGRLPAGWHVTPLALLGAETTGGAGVQAGAAGRATDGQPRGLAGRGWAAVRSGRGRTGPPRRRTGGRIETSVALRAVAIVLVVGTHAGLFTVRGGAHLLLGVAGWNFARFGLTGAARSERVHRLLTSIRRVALPSMAWIVGVYLVFDGYRIANVLLLNGFLGPSTWGTERRFWFVEALVTILLVLTVMLSVPAFDRLERRFPFALPVALLLLGLIPRYGLVSLSEAPPRAAPDTVLWLFTLGWAAARAATVRQRLVVTLAVAVTVPGFFGNSARDAVVIGGLALLMWAPDVRCPRWLGRCAGVLASSSLYIYLTHWHVYPHVVPLHPGLAVAASAAVGIAYWVAVTRLSRAWAGRRARLRRSGEGPERPVCEPPASHARTSPRPHAHLAREPVSLS